MHYTLKYRAQVICHSLFLVFFICSVVRNGNSGVFLMYNARLMVTCSGSLATINCELRQVRKEATVTVISGAEEWLGRVATLISVLPPERIVLVI